MPETPTVPPVTTNADAVNAVTNVIKPLANDAIKAEQHIAAMTAAYKAGGASAVAALLPALAPEIEQDYTDVKNALPAIKAGYKTTEFWAIVIGVGIDSYFTAKGQVAPVDGVAVAGALIAIYTVVRGLIKK